MTSRLFLCRTPLQARLFLEIAQTNHIDNFDVVYVTIENKLVDRAYFDRLGELASLIHRAAA